MRLIDADEVLARIENPYQWAEIARWFKDAPTIERKTGKWEEREVLSKKVIEEWQSARCSVCGRYHTTPYMYYFDNFSFCPNCGADMRGEGHETNRR